MIFSVRRLPVKLNIRHLLPMLTVLVALAGCVATSPVSAVITPTEGKNPVFDFARYPDAVWDRHLDLTRKASSSCGLGSTGRGDYLSCLMPTLDAFVRHENNTALSDLHRHMPLRYRYERSRNLRPLALLAAPFPNN
jgi:hypothetical protein